jgi:uncharacterized RDD family membrane protein YckC
VVDDRGATTELQRASRWARLGAAVCDGLAASIIVWVPFFSMSGAPHFGPGGVPTGGGPVAVRTWMMQYYLHSSGTYAGAAGLLVLVIVNLFWLHRYGQSIGKRLVGIKILRSDGARASLRRIVFIRDLPFLIIGFVPLLGGMVTLIDMLCIFGDRVQCLHDKVADTIVVKV